MPDLTAAQRDRFRRFHALYIKYLTEFEGQGGATSLNSYCAYQTALEEIRLSDKELHQYKILFAKWSVNGGEIC